MADNNSKELAKKANVERDAKVKETSPESEAEEEPDDKSSPVFAEDNLSQDSGITGQKDNDDNSRDDDDGNDDMDEDGDDDEDDDDEDDDDDEEADAKSTSGTASSSQAPSTPESKSADSPQPKKARKKPSLPPNARRGRAPAVAGLTIPFRTVKKAMKLDPDNTIVQNEAAIMTTMAAELFLKKLALKSQKTCKTKDRSTIRYEDIAEARSNDPSMAFLKLIFP